MDRPHLSWCECGQQTVQRVRVAHARCLHHLARNVTHATWCTTAKATARAIDVPIALDSATTTFIATKNTVSPQALAVATWDECFATEMPSENNLM